ncbi:MAG: TlyA family RNA methyltransferase [Clostridia bacterium]|nr:TlyA family RNA methyltransferase [Clostridia bacterium]
MRADKFLFEKGLANSRSHAAALLKDGVTLDGKRIGKPSQEIADDTPVSAVTIQNPSKYVSRGGIKLEAAVSAFSPELAGKTALDLGASTGGFTDCLLQNGAKRVYAVDVGHGQLDKTLENDPRVISLEGTNARTLTPEMTGEVCDLAVSDLSFISQALIYHAVRENVKDGGIFISLIKPQFEAGKENIGKGGIVRDRNIHVKVIEKLFAAAEAEGLYPEALAPSPIEGGDGNREYLALFRIGEKRAENTIDIKKTVFSS